MSLSASLTKSLQGHNPRNDPRGKVVRRKVYRKWALKHLSVAEPWKKLADVCSPSLLSRRAKWRSLPTTTAMERLQQESKRRIGSRYRRDVVLNALPLQAKHSQGSG
jgi:hypothetical protein